MVVVVGAYPDPGASTWGTLVAACRCSWCTGGSRAAREGSSAAQGGSSAARGGSTASHRGTGAQVPSGRWNDRRVPSHGRRSGSRGRRTPSCGRRSRGCGRIHGSTSFWGVGKAVRRKRSSWLEETQVHFSRSLVPAFLSLYLFPISPLCPVSFLCLPSPTRMCSEPCLTLVSCSVPSCMQLSPPG